MSVFAHDRPVGGEEDVLADGVHQRLVEAALGPGVRRLGRVGLEVGAELALICLVPPETAPS